MAVYAFIDPAPEVYSGDNKAMFDAFGLEAYDMIFYADMYEREERDYLAWAPNLGLTEDDEDEDGFDLGPEEPDEYGGD